MSGKTKVIASSDIASGQQPVVTKRGGVGFGPGAVIQAVPASDTATTIQITNAVPEAAAPEPVVEAATQSPEPEAAPAVAQVDMSAINTAIEALMTAQKDKDAVIEQAKADKEAAIEQANQAIEANTASAAEIAQLKNDLAEAKKNGDALAELGKLIGTNNMAAPQSLEVLGTGSQELRNWTQLMQQAPGSTVMHNNRQYVQRDNRSASAYLARHQNAIREGVEAELREAGFLQGAGAIVTNAVTVISDIPSSSFSYLSEFVRRPSDSTLIYGQFARNYAVPGTAPRLQGQVPRYPFAPGPTTKADRTLTHGTDIVSQRQNVVETLVPVTIEELGLGKDANNSPISLSNFVQAFSMQNLESIVQRNLGRDYHQTKDLFIRSEFFGANTIVYNNSNRVVSLPASVLAGGMGHATRGFLRALCANMSTMRIPTYSNGLYALILTPNQVQYLLDELATQQRFPEPASNEIEMISKILSMGGDEDYGGEVSGYRMTCDGFMIFQQNVHSTGAAGTPGAQDEAIAGGTHLTETCFAFGADAVCWATALPVEIRQDEVTNFGRRDSWIWYSHENSAPLDLNEVLVGPQVTRERRVLQVRFTNAPV